MRSAFSIPHPVDEKCIPVTIRTVNWKDELWLTCSISAILSYTLLLRDITANVIDRWYRSREKAIRYITIISVLIRVQSKKYLFVMFAE